MTLSPSESTEHTSTATVSSVTTSTMSSADSSVTFSSSATSHVHTDASASTTFTAATTTSVDSSSHSPAPSSTSISAHTSTALSTSTLTSSYASTTSSMSSTTSESASTSSSTSSTSSILSAPSSSVSSTASSSMSSTQHTSETASTESSIAASQTVSSSTISSGSSTPAFDPSFLHGAQALAIPTSTSSASDSAAPPSHEHPSSQAQEIQASSAVSTNPKDDNPPTPTVFSSGHEALQLVSPTQSSDDVADSNSNPHFRPSPGATTDTADVHSAPLPAEITPAPSPVLHAVSLSGPTLSAIPSSSMLALGSITDSASPTTTAVPDNPLASLLMAATAAASSRSVARFGSKSAGPTANDVAVLASQDVSTTLSTATATSMSVGGSPSSTAGATDSLVSSTIVRQGPSGTIVGFTGSGSFTPTPTSTPISTPGAIAHQQEAAASHRPLIIFAAIFGAFVLIGGIATVLGWIRKRLRQGKSFLWWNGRLQPDMMEELGFGSNYDPFRDGFKQQNKEISAKTGTTPASEQNHTEHTTNHQPTAADGSMPVYLMHDTPYQYPVANYIPGDANTSRNETRRLAPPKPWSPLQPRKDGGRAFAKNGAQESFPQSTFDNQFPSSGLRMSRRSTIRLDPQEVDITDLQSFSGVPPLPASIAQYYGSNGVVDRKAHFVDQNPFADSAQQHVAFAEDTFISSSGYTSGHDSPFSDASSGSHPIRDDETIASMYSTTSHALPAVEGSDLMSPLKQSGTNASGFHVVSEEGDAGRSPVERAESQASLASSISSDGTANSIDHQAVLTALHNRKLSLADRLDTDALSMDHSISGLSILQRK